MKDGSRSDTLDALEHVFLLEYWTRNGYFTKHRIILYIV